MQHGWKRLKLEFRGPVSGLTQNCPRSSCEVRFSSSRVVRSSPLFAPTPSSPTRWAGGRACGASREGG
eukprot:2857253-Alexandrium_andersonii.AAC.1